MKDLSAAERLRRILVLVPWVMSHKGVRVEEVCARFGITRDQLTTDLDLLYVCGLPPFGPGDLIEAFIEGDEVVIGMADYLARPPRLTRAEAIGLLVMGRAVAQLPGLEEADALRSALDKLSRAIAPDAAEPASELAERIEVELSTPGAELLGTMRAAVAEHQTLRLSYYSAGRGVMTERDIDPWLVFAANGYWYVAGLDRSSGEERTFRLDRIRTWAPTGGTFEAPPKIETPMRAGAPFVPSARDVLAVIEFAREAAWLGELIPFESKTAIASGWTRAELRTAHLAWLVRLLLTAGSHARAAGPSELVDEVVERARRALARY